jgi:hypothetical protein
MTRFLRFEAACVALSLLLLPGCGGSGSTVKRVVMSGNVTYEGKPIENGMIRFTCQESVSGAVSSEGKIKNGAYKLLDVIPGKNTVYVLVTKEQKTIHTYTDMPKKPDMSKVKLNPNMRPDEAMKLMGQEDAINQVPDNAQGNNATINVPETGGTQDIPLTKPAAKK